MSKSKFLFSFVFLMAMIVGGLSLYTWGTLTYSYSKGKRAGFLQKFSQRGWICKTWEGELVTGNMLGNQEKFLFSVRDEDVAKSIGDKIGRRVELDYNQHVGVPSTCFGETEYFITTIKEVSSESINLKD